MSDDKAEARQIEKRLLEEVRQHLDRAYAGAEINERLLAAVEQEAKFLLDAQGIVYDSVAANVGPNREIVISVEPTEGRPITTGAGPSAPRP